MVDQSAQTEAPALNTRTPGLRSCHSDSVNRKGSSGFFG